MGIGGKKLREKHVFIMSACRGHTAMPWGKEDVAGEACHTAAPHHSRDAGYTYEKRAT